ADDPDRLLAAVHGRGRRLDGEGLGRQRRGAEPEVLAAGRRFPRVADLGEVLWIDYDAVFVGLANLEAVLENAGLRLDQGKVSPKPGRDRASVFEAVNARRREAGGPENRFGRVSRAQGLVDDAGDVALGGDVGRVAVVATEGEHGGRISIEDRQQGV